jgi:hypothetical protein
MTRSKLIRTTTAACLPLLIGLARAQDGSPVLLSGKDAGSASLSVVGGKVVADRNHDDLRLTADDSTIELSYNAPEKSWDLSGFESVKLTVKNISQKPVMLRAAVLDAQAKGLEGTCRTAAEVAAGESRTITIRLIRRPEDPTFAPFQPFYMYFKGINVRDNSLDPARIKTLNVSVSGLEKQQSVEISPVTGAGRGKPAPVPFLPFIDSYGQYVHSDWPGKVYADTDFATLREQERQETASSPRPAGWNEYGGWAAGPTLKATGYFYPAKHEGKWWLVDPSGKLFWSYGPTGVGFGGDITPLNDRENWFVSLPKQDDPQLGQFFKSGRGAMFKYYQNREWNGFDIQRANLFRKYGADYEKTVADISHDRLHSWGFNSIGNWSAAKVFLMKRTPYTVALNSPSVSVMKGGDGHSFQDVYDARWEPGLYAEVEKQRATTAGDPWCIGYFVDNERAIGYQKRGASIGEMALKAPPTQPAKLKLIEQLKGKYKTIESINTAWKSSYASWDALAEDRTPPAMKDNPAMLADCGDFGMRFCERYFSISRDAVKNVAPNNMFLGTRFYGHTDPEVVALAGKYWDLISYNIYDNPPDGRVNQYAKLDLPILATEWGVGSDCMQTPFRNEKLTAETPAERAAKVTGYVQHAFALPNMVGAHFFQFRDQPLSGRPDGEATLRGFVNVADTPNFELVSANRSVAYRMYETRAGQK